MNLKINKVKELIGILFILLSIFTLYNQGFNGHYHRTADGKLIYHYHPYANSNTGNDSNSPVQNHHHSNHSLSLISLCNLSFALIGFIFYLLVLLIEHSRKKYLITNKKIKQKYYSGIISLRAPPALA